MEIDVVTRLLRARRAGATPALVDAGRQDQFSRQCPHWASDGLEMQEANPPPHARGSVLRLGSVRRSGHRVRMPDYREHAIFDQFPGDNDF